jgi:hypothetical protein
MNINEMFYYLLFSTETVLGIYVGYLWGGCFLWVFYGVFEWLVGEVFWLFESLWGFYLLGWKLVKLL